MLAEQFSLWQPWNQRQALPGIKFPGVYAIAKTETDLAGKPFVWQEDIIYIGVTISKKGLKGRLTQFDRTIRNKNTSHGGAHRVRFKYPDYHTLAARLFVAAIDVRCNVESLWLEYHCFAEYVNHFGHLPEFNDKELSPKK